MPKVSKDTAAKVEDFGAAVDHSSDLDGYTVNFVSIRETHDLAPMLANLPGRHLHLPALGLRPEGSHHDALSRPRGDVEAGDAFYFPPGHAPEAEAGTELIQFSPAEELATVVNGMREAMQAAQEA